MTKFILGLDLGQSADFSALAVLEAGRILDPRAQTPLPFGSRLPMVSCYALRNLRRWPLGTPYPKIVEDVGKLLGEKVVPSLESGSQPEPLAGSVLAVDQTGVGKAVVDMFYSARPKLRAKLQPIMITAGHHATLSEDGSWHVPKRELASTMQALLQSRRIKFAKLPETATLVKELQTFQVKITPAGNEIFESWRERDHDDMVLALAMACWIGERAGSPTSKPFVLTPGFVGGGLSFRHFG